MRNINLTKLLLVLLISLLLGNILLNIRNAVDAQETSQKKYAFNEFLSGYLSNYLKNNAETAMKARVEVGGIPLSDSILKAVNSDYLELWLKGRGGFRYSIAIPFHAIIRVNTGSLPKIYLAEVDRHNN